MTEMNYLWHRGSLGDWRSALQGYWDLLNPSQLPLERQMADLAPSVIAKMNPSEWYDFLLHKYFRWKYTAPNRYASTTKCLKTYVADHSLDELDSVRRRLLALDPTDIRGGLKTAGEIRGLGVASASGLLALLFPEHFGTVDQFVVKALQSVRSAHELEFVRAINPKNSLSMRNGILLIGLMREKARQLNSRLSTEEFNPRTIDMVLWSCRHDAQPKRCQRSRNSRCADRGTTR